MPTNGRDDPAHKEMIDAAKIKRRALNLPVGDADPGERDSRVTKTDVLRKKLTTDAYFEREGLPPLTEAELTEIANQFDTLASELNERFVGSRMKTPRQFRDNEDGAGYFIFEWRVRPIHNEPRPDGCGCGCGCGCGG